jgi:hypothetical protein
VEARDAMSGTFIANAMRDKNFMSLGGKQWKTPKEVQTLVK